LQLPNEKRLGILMLEKQHQIIENENMWLCNVCFWQWSTKEVKPLNTSVCPGVRRYAWGEAPSNLKTIKELRSAGLKPKDREQPQGCIWYAKQSAFICLYDEAETVERKQPTEKQKAGWEKAKLTKRTCPKCKEVQAYVLEKGEECGACEYKEIIEGIAADQAEAADTARKLLTKPHFVVLDTETTGLEGYVVEIAIISLGGQLLYNQRVKPPELIEPEASRVNHITDEMLVTCPTFSQIYPELVTILQDKTVLVYNESFDRVVLWRECRDNELPELPVKRWLDVMPLYSTWSGVWSYYFENYRWQILPYGDHSAVSDCQGVLKLLQEMATTKPPAPAPE
jgi:DNA polymerase-3 subunit epsilon